MPLVTQKTAGEAGGWVRKKIKRIVVVNGDKEIWEEGEGDCLGTLAVLNSEEKTDKFIVVHVPSGLSVVKWIDEEGEAKKIAQRLWNSCQEAFSLSTKQGVVSKTSAKVVEWLKKCKRAGKYVSP